MKFQLVTTGSGAAQPWLEEFYQVYFKKINPLQAIERVHLAAKKAARDQSSLKAEHENNIFFDYLLSSDFVIVFDERGVSLTSEKFAQVINQALVSGKKRAIFMVGGAYGFNDKIRLRADRVIALSPFVLNHHMAQAVAIEQIYRGLTILKGLPYHNA